MKELYKRSFEKLHTSEHLKKELETMTTQTKKKNYRKLWILAAAVVAVLALTVAASAAGVFETVRLWINGEAVDARDYLDANGDLTVEVTGEGRTDVLLVDGEAGADAEAVFVPNIDAGYETAEGTARLVFTNRDTGETEIMDLGAALAPGTYTFETDAFGWILDLTLDVVDGESYSLSFSVEAPAAQ